MRLTNSDLFLDHYGLGWVVDYVLFFVTLYTIIFW
jgi:hypothetical protein